MKFLVLGTYSFGTLGILGLLLIAHFERSGNAGQFRTLVNQLVSFNLDQVCKILPKGQLISECPFGPKTSSKIPAKLLPDFCPEIFGSFL